MKKVYIIFPVLCLLFSFPAFSQIGINTETPLQLLHIDTNNDNNAGSNSTDDVVMTREGNLGIGLTEPTERLHVNGTIRFNQGTFNAGDILLSDNDGNARWGAEPRSDLIFSDNDVDALLTAAGTLSQISNGKKMGPEITLPPGSWQLIFIAGYKTVGTPVQNVFWDLSDSSTANTNSVRILSGASTSGGIMPVTAIYFLTPSVTTTYSLWAFLRVAGSATYVPGSARMWAVSVGN